MESTDKSVDFQPAVNGNGVQKKQQPEQQPPNITLLEPAAGNGAITDLPVAAVAAVLSPPQQRPPRKLSFDDTDMELSRLKLGSAMRRFPLPLVLTVTACCAFVSLIVRYLLPFDSDILRESLDAANEWRQSIVQRTVLSFQDTLPKYQEAVQNHMHDTLAQFQNPSLLLLATLLGGCVTWFTYFVVYLDSSIPGVNPPTPFSASKKKNFSDKERRFHLGYVTALLSGLTVFMIVLLVD